MTSVGYLVYTHTMSNTPWYQTALSKACSMNIAARFRKISGQKSRDRSAVHHEYARPKHEIVKDFYAFTIP